MLSKKEIYIKEALDKIRSFNLELPVEISPGVKIIDLELYLSSIEKQMMNTDNSKMLKLCISKLETIINFKQ